jgi:hypothetical protein
VWRKVRVHVATHHDSEIRCTTRPWERACFAARLSTAFGEALAQPAPGDPAAPAAPPPQAASLPAVSLQGPAAEPRVLAALALVDAAGWPGRSAELLVTLLRNTLRRRAQACLQAGTGQGINYSDDGPIGEVALLAALTARCDAIGAAGLLEPALKAATGWAFANRALTRAMADEAFAESMHFAACLLNRYRCGTIPTQILSSSNVIHTVVQLVQTQCNTSEKCVWMDLWLGGAMN